MNNYRIRFVFTSLCLLFICSKCHKDEVFGPSDFYFRCKIDGSLYIPSNCANCQVGRVLYDSIFILNGNNGYQSVVVNATKAPFSVGQYNLIEPPLGQGIYKNTSDINIYDHYSTDSLHKGVLIVNSLDKANKIISGTFYFKALNKLYADSVEISEGRFRVQYIE